MYTITLHDGTRLKNLALNGNNYISDTVISDDVFVDNLDTVTIDNGESIEHYTNMVLMSNRVENGKSWFVLAEKTETEIEKLREEIIGLKEAFADATPGESQQILQRALFQAPAFLLAASQQLTDEEAEKMPDKMVAWQPGKTYEKDMVVAHKGALYRIVPQEGVTGQAHQEPGETGMLAVYRPLAPNEGEADGSLEKPFEFIYGMDVVEGLYYLYNEKVYVANQAVDNCIWYPGQAGVHIFALIS